MSCDGMCVKSSFWDHCIYLVKICYVDLFVGEFGIVYKAHYVKTMQAMPTFVAVKTLKGLPCLFHVIT